MGSFPNGTGSAIKRTGNVRYWQEEITFLLLKKDTSIWGCPFLLFIKTSNIMPGLGYVSLNKFQQDPSIVSISIDESVCGIIFDISKRENLFDDYPIINQYFGNGQVQIVTNMEDVEAFGIVNNGFLSGVPYYHLSQFYKYIEKDATLYIMFADCSESFEAIQQMQLIAKGAIYQVGIWTEQPLWYKDGDDYRFTELLTNIKVQTDELCGMIDQPTDSSSPLSIILCANTAWLNDSTDSVVNFKKIPYARDLEMPKISILLGQDGTDEVHQMQQNNYQNCPVGYLGLAMACCYLAPAEESIGYVDNYDLNKNDDLNNPELGFGDIESGNYNPMDKISYTRANIISLNGYIIPVRYKAKEACLYFSNDQTLSEKDYQTLALNRVIHKCKRVVRSVLLPFINSNAVIDAATGRLTATSITVFTNMILNALDQKLINVRGQEQINGRFVDIDDEQNIIDTDEIRIEYTVVPVNTNTQIRLEELYTTNA